MVTEEQITNKLDGKSLMHLKINWRDVEVNGFVYQEIQRWSWRHKNLLHGLMSLGKRTKIGNIVHGTDSK